MIELLAADWNHWPDGLSPAGIAATAAAAGVAGLELGVYDIEEELAPGRLAEWHRLGERYRVPVRRLLYSMPPGRWPTGGLGSKVMRFRLLEQMEALVEIGSDLGLDVIGLWPGADPPDADREMVARTISELSVLANRRGMRIAIEPKPDTVVSTPGDVLDLGATAASGDAIGVLLDIGHEHAAGRDPSAIVPRLGDRLLHIHLGDSDGDPDADLPPGHIHPLDPFLAALEASGYQGAMSPDTYGAVASGALTGAEALEETMRRVSAYRMSR
ncbi:MAG: sugar phosphate isomerase/epimerase [Actinobacteria bacterium]|nr:sugar phosphate isomerase/epimerase [Actinomycetota bacterium]